ncbi:helix-turn-helix transcriptional regulator [Nonomuraea jiangxiensis]|uniref:helix-turn-helix transcriptional regulator n=1 Tax=Nonomuraea jiangxiensis TaxID=633440 RepID=UPI000ADC8B0A
MSRTAFATRFKQTAGRPPLTYLNELCMKLADQALRTGTDSISKIAAASGYGSVSAFSTAFKRATGLAPRTARSHRTGHTAPAAPTAMDTAQPW